MRQSDKTQFHSTFNGKKYVELQYKGELLYYRLLKHVPKRYYCSNVIVGEKYHSSVDAP